jgi:hypothetical protein
VAAVDLPFVNALSATPRSSLCSVAHSASWFNIETGDRKMTIERKRTFDVLFLHEHE